MKSIRFAAMFVLLASQAACAFTTHNVSYDEHRGEPLARPTPPGAFQVRTGAYAVK